MRSAGSAALRGTTSSVRSPWRLVKRNVPLDAQLVVDGIPAASEVIVDPEIGLHVRPNLR